MNQNTNFKTLVVGGSVSPHAPQVRSTCFCLSSWQQGCMPGCCADWQPPSNWNELSNAEKLLLINDLEKNIAEQQIIAENLRLTLEEEGSEEYARIEEVTCYFTHISKWRI